MHFLLTRRIVPRSVWRHGLVAALVFLCAGCGPRDPLDRKVHARGANAVNMWQSRLAGEFSAADRVRIEGALQEIRLRIMGDKEATGSAAIAEALGTKIHGRTVREVIQLGCELRLVRLRGEGAELERAMEQNSRLVTRPGDRASETHLVELYGRQSVRLEKYRTDILAAEKELAALVKVTGRLLHEPPKLPEKPTDTPDVMPERVKRRA